jgi:hypothetical protein
MALDNSVLAPDQKAVKFTTLEGLRAQFVDGCAPSIETLRIWSRKGLIPSMKIGNVRWYPEDALSRKIQGGVANN